MSGLSREPELAQPAMPTGAAAARLQAPTGARVALGLAVFAVVWLLHLSATSLSPPVDNIEQLTWVRSLQWGYYKHPPLPTWLLWLPVQVLGWSGWTTYLLGGTVTLAAMGVFWHLLRDLRGSSHATLALLATLCITYYNGRLNYYNHNVVLLLAAAVSAWCCWRAFDEKRLRWWLALGVALGLGALTKYQIVVTALSVLCFWVSQRGWREPLHVRGLLLAALIALLILTPHLLWLVADDFGPIRYAMATSLDVHLDTAARLLNASKWFADQLLNRSLPALILLGLCAHSVLRDRKRGAAAAMASRHDEKPGSRALIVCWAAVPLLFMPALGVGFGSDLQLQWGTAFLPFVVPAAMELLPREFWRHVRMAFALKLFLGVQGFLLLLSYVTSPVGVDALKDHHWRTFNSKRLAADVAAPARAALGGPIRVVIGNPAISGALALQLPEQPVILIDGNLHNSPWVVADLVGRCGALEVFLAALPPANATPVGTDFPSLYWRVVQPVRPDRACPPPAPGRGQPP